MTLTNFGDLQSQEKKNHISWAEKVHQYWVLSETGYAYGQL